MREFRPYGSVRGALSNGRPYRDSVALIEVRRSVGAGIRLTRIA